MITREQYLNALELVDQYHRQSKTEPVSFLNYVRNNKIHLSTRTFNALWNRFDYVDDINEKTIRGVRNLGKKGIEEWFEATKNLNKIIKKWN